MISLLIPYHVHGSPASSGGSQRPIVLPFPELAWSMRLHFMKQHMHTNAFTHEDTTRFATHVAWADPRLIHHQVCDQSLAWEQNTTTLSSRPAWVTHGLYSCGGVTLLTTDSTCCELLKNYLGHRQDPPPLGFTCHHDPDAWPASEHIIYLLQLVYCIFTSEHPAAWNCCCPYRKKNE